MITYAGNSWCDTLLRWRGTTFKACLPKVSLFAVYLSCAYALQVLLSCNFGAAYDRSYVAGKTLSFLLIFRMNSSYKRFWEGRQCCAGFFSNLRNLGTYFITLFKGGHGQYIWNRRHGEDGFSMERKAVLNDPDDAMTSVARTDVVRWSLALAVAFKIHARLLGDCYLNGWIDEDVKWRLNFDRMRLRTLMSKAEFDFVDSGLKVEDSSEESQLLWNSGLGEPQVFHQQGAPMHPGSRYQMSFEPTQRQFLVILNFLVQTFRLYTNEPYAFKERFLPEFIKIMNLVGSQHDHIHQIMKFPLPLPYVNLVRTLLVAYLFAVPFFIEYTQGLLANVVMPTLMAFALLGIDQTSTELENPFGDDANDVDVQSMISSLERELIRTLEFAGDGPARDAFTWLPVPKFMQKEAGLPFAWYVALKSEVGHMPIPKSRGPGGLRVRHVNLEGPVRAAGHHR